MIDASSLPKKRRQDRKAALWSGSSPKQCPRPLFELNKAYRKAFREAVADYGQKRI
jgi:hypothetical protein